MSAFQIQFGGERITTPGDAPDVLIAFNPAALVVNLPHLEPGALVLVDEGSFTAQRLKRADLASNPMDDGSLDDFHVVPVDISHLTVESVKEFGLGTKDSLRCKNFWALGLVLWMFDQPREPTLAWINTKFHKLPAVRDANLAALNAGHAYGETAQLSHLLSQETIPEAALDSVEYRTITGAEALSLGLVAAAELADRDMLFCSYPITPASALLHHLADLEDVGVATFQAEDEVAAVCSAIGASYAGKIGVTSSSGPGVALKSEAIGLAVATELPLVIVNSQRAGPSTGMPTKTEQSDLYQAVYGRNADTPVPVVASRSPADCFETAIEAVRIAVRHMTPVMLLTDGYLANASELWPIPDFDSAQPIERPDLEHGNVFERKPETLARQWAAPGDVGFRHRVGGIERDIVSGNISYEADNHQQMTDMRASKLASVAEFIGDQQVDQGLDSGLAVIAWGSTYGTLFKAVRQCIAEGYAVGHIHLRYIHPLPANLAALLGSFDDILVPELNNGQLATVLRDKLGVTVRQLNQVSGQPFQVGAVAEAIRSLAPQRIQEVNNG